MKKEWIYFVAGAGLMASVMTFNMPKKNLTDCEAIARAVEDDNFKGLDYHNKKLAVYLRHNSGSGYYGSIYYSCMGIKANEG